MPRNHLLLKMHTTVSLAALRSVISQAQRVSFWAEGLRITADIYLLGQAKKTGAYVAVAWCVQPALGWQQFRFAMMRDLKVVGLADGLRVDFDPGAHDIRTIDTHILSSANGPRPQGRKEGWRPD